MTEKRFIPVFTGYEPHRLIGAKDNGKIITFEEMFNLLNSLSEENERLRHDIKCLELFSHNKNNYTKPINYTIELFDDGTYSFNKNSKPLFSRQQLEEQNDELHEIIHDYAKIIENLKRENEQLKKEIEELKWNLELER